MKTLQECDFVTAANLLSCEVAAIKAVASVESAGGGFLPNGKPKILFEGHVFYRLTNGRFGVSNVSYPKWIKDYYNQDQYTRLDKATALDRSAALQSASCAALPTTRQHSTPPPYVSLQEFINAMFASETEHLMAFVRFVKSKKLQGSLERKDWAAFALGYNGKGYKANKYDEKMAAAYRKFKQ